MATARSGMPHLLLEQFSRECADTLQVRGMIALLSYDVQTNLSPGRVFPVLRCCVWRIQQRQAAQLRLARRFG